MDMALFECGAVFHGGEPGEQENLLTGILVGRTVSKDIHGESRGVDIYDAKADIEAVMNALGAPAKLTYNRGVNGWWHPGRSAKVGLGPKKILGAFGEIHPKVLDALNVKGPVVAFAIHTAEIPMPRKKSASRGAVTMADLQSVERDFSFVVDADVEAVTLLNAAAGADKNLIEDVRIFDEFIGGALGEGKKSLAITVRLQPTEKTLKEADIETVATKIVEKVSKATGGTLRG